MYLFFRAVPACMAIAFLVTAPNVRAEKTSAWVDPPAKTDEAAKGDAAKPTEPAKMGGKSLETKSQEQARKPSTTRTTHSDPAEDRRARNRRQAGSTPSRERRMSASSETNVPVPFTPDSRFPDWAGKAQRLAGDYLDVVSAPNAAMLAASLRFYGERVRFHGRTMSTAALIAEKRRFVRRWPERRYAPQDGTMRTACTAASATCIVRTVMNFRAESPARGVLSQGLSELILTVSFSGERPVIVAESSRVLRRGSATLGAAGRVIDDGA